MSNNSALSKARGVHTGLPMFFRARCREATQGGDRGYYGVGYTLAGALGHEQPYDLDMDEWGEEIGALLVLLDQDNSDGTWAWLVRHYPARWR